MNSVDQYKEELDLQEHTRMATTHLKLNQIISQINDLDVFPSLVWVWCWDVVKDKLDTHSPGKDSEYLTNQTFTEEDVWWMFVQDLDKNSFSLEYGAEDLDEAIFDWMTERDILVSLDEDTWLDDQDSDEESE
jgi:hypothetical protein